MVRITIKARNGTGFCIVESRDTRKKYEARGPAYSIISDSEIARITFNDAMRKLFEGEVRQVETSKHNQMTI